jgi:hypothetical protein
MLKFSKVDEDQAGRWAVTVYGESCEKTRKKRQADAEKEDKQPPPGVASVRAGSGGPQVSSASAPKKPGKQRRSHWEQNYF